MYSQEKLLKMIADNHPSVRYEACEWLRVSQESSPEVVNALEKATHDLDHEVAERAQLALQADVHHYMAIQMGLLEPDRVPISAETQKVQSSIICPNCKAENPAWARYCNQCSAELPALGQLPGAEPFAYTSSPKKSHKTLWIILASLGGLAVIAIIAFVVLMSRVNNEAGPTAAVLDEFAKHLAARDVQAAYEHCSPDFKASIPLTTLELLVKGDSYQYIEGYQSLSITSIHVTWYTNNTFAEVEAASKYVDGTGVISAILQKVGDTWMINRFDFHKNIPITP